MDLESEIDIYYDCDECNETFSSGSEMEAHKIEVHLKRYKCQYCELSFTQFSVLKSHINCEHKSKQPKEKVPCSPPEVTQSQNTPVQDSKHTGKEGGHKVSQKLHICYNCNKTFTTSRGMRKHISLVHECKHLYSCPDCSQSFRLESSLERHIDKEHLQLGKESHHYKCDECGKTLASGCLFHVCKNEVPLTCEECGDSFVNSIDFKTHKRTFHKPKKYACTECEKQYAQKERLDYHLKISHLDKYLEMQVELVENQRTVSSGGNVKKHKCDFCDIAFARPENLKRHIQRMHKAKVLS